MRLKHPKPVLIRLLVQQHTCLSVMFSIHNCFGLKFSYARDVPFLCSNVKGHLCSFGSHENIKKQHRIRRVFEIPVEATGEVEGSQVAYLVYQRDRPVTHLGAVPGKDTFGLLPWLETVLR